MICANREFSFGFVADNLSVFPMFSCLTKHIKKKQRYMVSLKENPNLENSIFSKATLNLVNEA